MATEALRRRESQTIRKIKERVQSISQYVWADKVPVTDVSAAATMEHLTPQHACRLKYEPVQEGFRWGEPWGTVWFRLRITVPRHHKGETVSLLFEPEGECIIFEKNKPIQGLNPGRKDCVLLKRAKGGERIELFVEAGAVGCFGEIANHRVMHQPQLAVFDRDVFSAYWDLNSLTDMINIESNDPWRVKLIYQLNKAVDLFDYHTDAQQQRRLAARNITKALKPIHDRPATSSAQTIACMGHAHIDVAWLWPLAETQRKCGRTFSNVLALMDRYPEFVFCQSQPQLYEYTKEKYPDLYRRIKQKVRTGKWIPTGCAWVEMDCNVTSGESLVRQILFGTRFFEEEFNITPACLWLPDVFGYSAALPQILKQSGFDNFLTQKISWSQYTVFPFHSFHWEGIDGTRVLTHFLPSNTYNASLRATEISNSDRNYREKDRSPIHASLYGHGDGGGGPDSDHLERLSHYSDLENMPKLVSMSPGEFFEKLRNESTDLPLWVGELYLEVHRATYTTQARNKRFNRLSEFALRDAEMWSALGLAHDGPYDQAALNAAWKLVLLNQFHDILPGSSIKEVYEDSDRDYAQVLKSAGSVRDRAVQKLDSHIDTRGEGIPVIVRNSLSWQRKDMATVEPKGLRSGASYVAVRPNGDTVPVQRSADGSLRFIATTPSVGHAVYYLRPGPQPQASFTASPTHIENECVSLRFDEQGRLKRITDKVNHREVLTPGAVGNQLQIFEDKPLDFEAWDIDIFYHDKLLAQDGRLISAKVVENGPNRTVLRMQRAISHSTMTQDVVLSANSPRIDFVTTIEWGNEADVLLKVAFPVDVRSDKARYEIQFGNIERSTHWNTPQDFAKFEVPAQRWADLSEGDYGVALLNDCKYGYDIKGNVMRLSLLRAPMRPRGNVRADVNETHVFTYSILPHAGDYKQGVVRAGYELNVPLTAGQTKASPGSLPATKSCLGISGNNVVIETVKKAEDSDDLIVRLYEAHGCRGSRTVTIDLPVEQVEEVNPLEKTIRSLPIRDGKLKLTFSPFEIRTLKMKT